MTTLPLLLLLAAPAADAPSFERQVAPLLRERCLACHSGSHPKGGLDLTRRAGLLTGGDTGPAVVPGKSAESPLVERVRDGKMPPKQPLAAAEVQLLTRWIDAGANWPGPAIEPPKAGARDWWSLRPVQRPALPRVSDPNWVRTPIDAFLLARLDAAGLHPAPETDRRTWLRRVTVDLTGLLPTPEEIDAFLADRSPDAYEKVADRLLASPAYGERWARHWLDVVRFAESHGYEMNTLRPNAWPYRDYVIRALNEDRPFARFVREQLAGDVVGRDDALTQAATGFLVAGPHDLVGNQTLEGQLQQRQDDLSDMAATTGATFLGLTVGCARCHDHKFDPITQKDFYALQAVFAGVEHAERPIETGDPAARRREAESVRAELERLEQKLDAVESPAGSPGTAPRRNGVQPRRNLERFAATEARFVRFRVFATTDGLQPCVDELEVFGPDAPGRNLALASGGAKASASSVYPNSPLHRLEHIHDGRYGNGRSWISNEPGRGWVAVELPLPAFIDHILWGRDREGKYTDRLARDYTVEVSMDGIRWAPVAGSWDRLPPNAAAPTNPATAGMQQERRRLADRLTALEKPPLVYAGRFRTPDSIHRLNRGDPMQKREPVEPGAVAAVGLPFPLRPGATEADRRLALADWIADPTNPLSPRVMVNRVWHWHFGQGLVRTPSDFGANGDRPSHPELLDFLAAEFLANGGRLKPLHRLIVLSAAYRQSGRSDPSCVAVDAGNRLLWRWSPRRLEAEAVRDAMLQVSGSLDRRLGGPGYHLWDYTGYVISFQPKVRLGPEADRRMVYQFKPRLQQDGTFGAFDCPDATTAMPKRNVSTTALQALNLLNDPFVLGQCDRFAERLRCEAGPDVAAQVTRAFRLSFGRDPTAAEATGAAELVRAHGLAALGRALFNANEFMFVE